MRPILALKEPGGPITAKFKETELKTTYFTICSWNYLAYARVLGASIRQNMPGADFLIFIADDRRDASVEDLEIVLAEELGIPCFQDLTFKYSILEFNTAIKPFCFDYLFDRARCDVAVFLDPDIEVFAPLTLVENAMHSGASCAVTPHLLQPITDGRHPSNLDILASGTFNLGFAAFSNVPEARAFLKWWGEMLLEHCYADPAQNLFVDQKFVDFAPSFMERLEVIRHPGYNLAYWNLAQRHLVKTAEGFSTLGSELVFFHFSGVQPGNDTVFSKHQDRLDMASAGEAADLVRKYIAKLTAQGHDEWSRAPYGFGNFADGHVIPSVVRRAPFPQGRGEAASRTYDAEYWNSEAPDVDQPPGAPISRLMQAIHVSRRDLQDAYPLSSVAGRRRYHDWFLIHGLNELGLSEAHLPVAQAFRRGGSLKLGRAMARLRLLADRFRQNRGVG